MKKISSRQMVVLFSLVAVLLQSGCKKADKILTFSIYNSFDFTIGANSPVNLPFELQSPDITTNSSSQFENNNSDAAHVKDIRLKNVTLTITDPSGQTFSFLKSVHIYISTNSSNEIELASLDDVQSNASQIELTTTNEKLDDYVKSPTYNVRTSYVTRQLISRDITIRADSRFEVKATARK